MKRFYFRLDKLLHYQEQRQKQADLRLRQAGLERDTAHADVERVQHQLLQTCRLDEAVGRPVEPHLRIQTLRHAEQLSQTLGTAQEKLKTAELRFREANRQRTEVTQEVESLRTLRQRQWRDHRDEAARQQQVELDEVVMQQWSAQNVRDASLAGGQSE